MSNEFFSVSGSPSTSSFGASATMRSEFVAVAAGFDKLPTLSGNGSKLVQINSGGSAMVAIALTVGAILFGGAAGALGQDGTNLFWDNTAKRLGIGNAAPSVALDVTGAGKFSTGLTVSAGGIVVTGNSTITGTLGGVTTFTATTLVGTLSTAAQTNITSLGTLTALAMGGTLTMGANTLALASSTVSGTPTWSSNQAITLSTAAQPNVTSLGTLTSIVTSGALNITATASKIIPGATSLALRNNADNADNILIADNGNVTIRGTLTGGGIVAAIVYVFDGGGAALTTGVKGDLLIPFGCTINSVTLEADQSGSIVIDIWKKTYALDSPPAVGQTITASAKPTLASHQSSQDATLSGWTTAVSANDMLRFNIDSITTCTRVTLTLKVTKT